MSKAKILNKKVIAWALYDWANSAFALSVLAVLFPLFLGSYWSVGDSGAQVTARLAFITAASSAVVSILAPIFGTIADAGGYRKRFLLVLALIGASMTATLGLVGEGNWPWALGLYLVASFGFYSSTVFYDSLIIDVTETRYYSFVSSLGFSLGYLGGATLLALHVWMLTSPATFGLATATDAMKLAFISVGVWWAVFLLPLIAFVPEHKSGIVVAKGVIRAAYRELQSTIREIRRYRKVVVFLTAYCLYIGAVFTVIFMAANYGQRLGFSQQDLVRALMITNFVGFPATLLYGVFGHRFGPKIGIYVALTVYVVVSGWAAFMTDVHEFYVMAIIIGCVQGGVQGLSRSLYASLIPPDQPGEFFGFYNMVTKVSHVIGPVLVGLAATVSEEPKFVLLALLPLFIGGALLLRLIPADAVMRDHTDRNAHRDT
ncbi:MAG: MFS transporter [Gammaproteobacteria bacterium]|nr:MFS transporter [Gammaproteobacteria bacterium]MDH3429771.1 MFS transporter [Gammaproteobacteria bacterium]